MGKNKKHHASHSVMRETAGAVSTPKVGSAARAMEQLEPRVLLAGTGLTAAYFDNQDFTGPSVSRVDPQINFNWQSGSPAPEISPYTYPARWSGQVQPLYSQTYT